MSVLDEICKPDVRENPKNFHFCPRCGARLKKENHHGHTRLVCPKCGFIFYQNPVPAAGVLLRRNHDVLLVKRRFEPRAGLWSLPAGFMEYGETVEETAVRELKEETNLDVVLTRLFGVYTGCDDPRNQAVLIVYEGKITGGQLRPGDDASDVRFFPLDALPKEIAFEAHKRVLDALKEEVLRAKKSPNAPKE